MNIPNEYKIAGGKTIKVTLHDELSDGKFGDFSPAKNEIRLARKVEEDGESWKQSIEDIERTFYHEMFHSFQWYFNTEFSEEMAQSFSNFMYEMMHTSNGNLLYDSEK